MYNLATLAFVGAGFIACLALYLTVRPRWTRIREALRGR